MLVTQSSIQENEDLRTIKAFHPELPNEIQNEVVKYLQKSIQEKAVDQLSPQRKNLTNIQVSSCKFKIEIVERKNEKGEKDEEKILGFKLKVSSLSHFSFRGTLEIFDDNGSQSSSKAFEGFLEEQLLEIIQDGPNITIEPEGLTKVSISLSPIY